MIATLVAWRIVLSVNVGCDNPCSLAAHVVESSGNGSGAYCVGIARVPAYLKWACYKRRLVRNLACAIGEDRELGLDLSYHLDSTARLS
jgi:hypothetical protein